jgi:hypothetical protein
VSRLNEQTDEYTVATFIACIGPEVLQLYNALPFDDEQDKKKMDTVLRRMEAHCVGEINVIYERFQFQQRRQREGETAEQYITALRALARSCEFGTTLDELVRDRVVFGVGDNACCEVRYPVTHHTTCRVNPRDRNTNIAVFGMNEDRATVRHLESVVRCAAS